MSYFAAAVLSGQDGWTSSEVDLSGVADVEEVADRLRDIGPSATTSILFVESDDSYLVVLRVDESDDVRVFGSDGAFADESRLGALLLRDVEEPALEIDEVEAEQDADETRTAAEPVDPDIDPVGDADLLADLGVPSHRLLQLCAHGGLLPSDITAEICQLMGCADEMEELREA